MSKTVHGFHRATETVPQCEHLIFEEKGDVAYITLNRPEVINALSIDLSREFCETLEYVRDQAHLHILVIKGAGENFCAGDDLTEMASGSWGHANQVMRRVRYYQHMANTLEELDKITICAVDGYCVGGGLEITMACDFVICTNRVKWGMPEVDWGITPGWGGTTRMARLIGRRMTKEINLLGALHSPWRGLELGLFNRVVPDDELAGETQALIELLQCKNHQGLRQLKFMINKNVEADLYTAQAFEALGAALTVSINGAWEVPDADGAHGWESYHAKDKNSAIRNRREKAKNFWVD
ncbi:MAG: enoyl-CoA hydratase/isomerase family protein [Alphaproteobacteria bacterium]|jgi:enoyl-CoA hydratase|nr:enoyl-CoA hydratase/isomerase family protein [Alphaproteobacteria bacterium]MDF1625968.1 enoyl-CoA hydratase/isomerase family protein [Parvibaculaceae bacterium]